MSKIKTLIISLVTIIFAVILTLLSIIYVYFYLIKPPFTSADLSIDLGILILKDGFVRFVWIVFDLMIVIFLLRFIYIKINDLRNFNIKKHLHFLIRKRSTSKIENHKNETNNLKVLILSVKDFMKEEGYISVHNTLRADSENFLYVTFIKENKSVINIYISKRASKHFQEGQAIIKGFFDSLVIAKVDGKLKLVSSDNYSK